MRERIPKPPYIERPVEAPKRLNIDEGELALLTDSVNHLKVELSESPTVSPSLSRLALSGVSVGDDIEPVIFSFDRTLQSGKITASEVIAKSANAMGSSWFFNLLANSDFWEVRPYEASEPTHIISTSSLVAQLDKYLPSEVFGQLLDIDPKSETAIFLLSNYLKHKKCKTRIQNNYYQTPRNKAVEVPFMRETDFMVQQNNSTTKHILCISGNNWLDDGSGLIKKRYIFETKSSSSGNIESAAYVSFSGAQPFVTRRVLESYAKKDSKLGDPIQAFYTAIDDIRGLYGLNN